MKTHLMDFLCVVVQGFWIVAFAGLIIGAIMVFGPMFSVALTMLVEALIGLVGAVVVLAIVLEVGRQIARITKN
jgi:hypothetical protein